MKYLIYCLVLLLTGCSVVLPGHKGVRLHFGKIQDGVVDEGYYVYIPFVRSTKSLSVRVQKDVVETSAASKDMQELTSHVAINWHINPADADKFYQHIGDEQDAVDHVILPSANEVLKASTAKKTAEEILAKRAELKTEIDQSLRTWLARYGVLVDDVSIVDINFTKDFSQAVERKQIAEQEAKQAEYIAQKAIREAEAEVNRAKGQAEAQKLIRVSITPEILQQKAIEKWDGKFPQVMGNTVLPFINLNVK